MKQKRNPERKQPTFGKSYIMHLYGWGVWWENQEKTIDLSNMEKVQTRTKKSELQKQQFVSKFFKLNNQSQIETKPPILNNSRSSATMSRHEKSDDDLARKGIFNGGGTPKRVRDIENCSVEKCQSPSKKIKLISKKIKFFEEQESTAFQFSKKNSCEGNSWEKSVWTQTSTQLFFM